MRRTFPHRLLTIGILSLLAFLPAMAGGDRSVVVKGPKGERRVSEGSLASLPRLEVAISDHGTPAKFEGVEIQTLLELAGAPTGEHLRGKELTKVVLVEARDGYRAVFSLAELSGAFTDRRVILADRRDGKLLSDEEGPFRIVVEGEKRMGRCVRQVTVIRMAEAK